MYRRILVPIDASKAARRGLAEALALAHEMDAEVVLVHVVNTYLSLTGFEPTVAIGSAIDTMREAGRNILKRAEAQARARQLTTRSYLLEALAAPAATSILRQARKSRADLIVMGTHGRKGLRRLVEGSDAEDVVRGAPVPVLLVRAQARIARPRPNGVSKRSKGASVRRKPAASR